MENYILKLVSGTTYRYKLYSGTTLVSDTDLAALFATSGSAYFSFDLDGGTSYESHVVEIINSSNTRVVYNNELTATVSESKNYKATWSANATAFDTFEELPGKTLDESQLGFLMGKIKEAGNNIGNLSSLTTTDKSSAVTAINEVNAKVLANAGAPTTSTVGTVGQLLVDTTNGKLYICTDATNPYVWEEVGAGGGGGGGGGEVTEIQLTATTVIKDLITGGTIDKTGRYLLVNDTANNITLHANTSTETTDLARIDAGRQAILDVVLYERNSVYVGYYYAVLNYRDNNGGHSLHFTQYTVPGDTYNTFVDTGSFVSYINQNDYSHAPSSAVVWTQIQQATIGVPLVIMAASDNDTSTGFHVNTAYGRQYFIDNFMLADVKPVIIQIYIGPNSAVGLPEGYYRFEVSGRSESGDIYLTYTHYDGTFYGGICPASSQSLEFTVTKH